jgi:hypothetical protein
MSRIIFFIDSTDNKLLISLHNVLKRPLAQVKQTIDSGLPVIDVELFDSEYMDKAAVLRKLLEELDNRGMQYKIFEVPEGNETAISACTPERRITADVLRNILRESDLELERQMDNNNDE